jgi:predicted Zn-dependent protease with MMP-like domain
MDERSLERFWESAWEAIDRGEPDAARRAAEKALRREPELPEAHYISGMAYLELDEPERAAEAFERARSLAPEWPEATIGLAWARFRLCDFDAAETLLGTTAKGEDAPADAFYLRGLLAERRRDETAAARAFAEARRRDPEGYPNWPRLSDGEFRRHMERSLARLPRRFRDAIANVAIVLEPWPPAEVLREESPPYDPEILGLYVGVPSTARSVESSGELPGMIYLFQRNLERHAGSEDELPEQIAITLYHEIAHALGFEEDEMPGLGLD